jgi:hypothetical protein
MTPIQYPITGTASYDPDTQEGLVSFRPDTTPPPPDPPPHDGTDMIDLSQVVITRDSPDVRSWPIGAKFLRIDLSPSANAGIEFSKRNGPEAWPFVRGPEGGEIQYTLWVVCKIGGIWYTCGSILCISRAPNDNYVPTGPTLEIGQLPNNWYYFCGDPLQEYQPQPGEQVGWFLTSGVQRRNDIHTVAERTQVVLASFSPGSYPF